MLILIAGLLGRGAGEGGNGGCTWKIILHLVVSIHQPVGICTLHQPTYTLDSIQSNSIKLCPGCLLNISLTNKNLGSFPSAHHFHRNITLTCPNCPSIDSVNPTPQWPFPSKSSQQGQAGSYRDPRQVKPTKPSWLLQRSRASQANKAKLALTEISGKSSQQSQAGSYRDPCKSSQQSQAGSYRDPGKSSQQSQAGSYRDPGKSSQQSQAGSYRDPCKSSQQSQAGSYRDPRQVKPTQPSWLLQRSRGPHIWNNLLQSIRHSATLSSFKSQLKTFLFSEYFI